MVADSNEDFERLQRRVEFLELALRLILETEVAGPNRLDRYFDKPFSRREPGMVDIHSLEYLVDRYFRRGAVFDEVSNQIGELRSRQERQISELRSRQERLVEDLDIGIDETKRDGSALAAEVHHWLAIQSLGLKLADVRMPRFIPMRVYRSDVPDGGIEGVVAAIGEFAKAFGLKLQTRFPKLGGLGTKSGL
jgi:hypothetical protein